MKTKDYKIIKILKYFYYYMANYDYYFLIFCYPKMRT